MTELFSDLIKALSTFIARDVMYLVGGGSVCVTLLHVSGQALTNDYPVPIWLLAAGVAYGVGYAIQEILSLFPILATAPVLSPKAHVQWFYRRFTREVWNDVNPSAWPTDLQEFYDNATNRNFAQYQRIISLKHVGATLGANWLVCSFMFGIYATENQFERSALVLTVSLFILSTGLIAMAWVKVLQEVQYIFTWAELVRTDEPRESSA